jgi:superfamily II DNA or RNA helicase
VEEVLDFRVDGVIERARAPRLLAALEDCTDVRLGGEPVQGRGAVVLPRIRVEDFGLGFRLRLVRDPGIEEVFANGVVRCGDELRPIASGDFSREQRQRLIAGVVFEASDVGRLVGEQLPWLRARVPVDVVTSRLPDGQPTKPRLVFETGTQGDLLEVLPLLIYGDPPVARIDRGELHLLGGTVPIRNLRLEQKLVRRLADDLGMALGLKAHFRGARGVRMARTLQGFGAETRGDGVTSFRRAGSIEPRVHIEGRRLDVDFGGADPLRLMRAWRDGESMVRTTAGWAPLPEEWLQKYGHLVANLLEAREASGKVVRSALIDLAALCELLDHPAPPGMEPLRRLAEDFEQLPEAELPEDFRGELRAYQVQGVNWLHFLVEAELGGILADDMGLGKTVQALCSLRGRTLVVCPTSVLHNWMREAERFRPGLKLCLYHGPSRTLDPDADLVMTSYALLRIDQQILCHESWGTVVLDEAQAIKNPESQVAQAAFRLQAETRFALTGTPIENRLDELWSQLHFTCPGLLGGRSDFQTRIARPLSYGEPGVAEQLRRRIRPFVLRRLKSEVAPELPPRTEIVLRSVLSEEERSIYDVVRAASRAKVAEALQAGGVMVALEALLRLRQACCHASLVPGQHLERSNKLTLLMETLTRVVAAGHKALVFSQWTSLLDLVEPLLQAEELAFERLDGSTRDRAGVVQRFQDTGGPPVLLLSLKAGGVGLNLTAADHVFLLDPWWNPATEDQAADRAHRIGQDRPVVVCRLVAQDTVEERILALQERKRALAEAALGEANQAGGLTRDDLLELLA